jgi:hypothetical protein
MPPMVLQLFVLLVDWVVEMEALTSCEACWEV